MKTIAFYDPYITGHHLEYIFHIINYKIKHNINAKFLFYVCKDFNNSIGQLVDINDIVNESIDIINIESLIDDHDFKLEQTLSNYKKQLKAVEKEIVSKKINHCVFMYLDNAMQIALSTSLSRNIDCKISGILLNPFGGFGKGILKYYYSFRRVLQNYIMMLNRNISAIYIITDEQTTKRLNLIHLTNKFKYISDPIIDFEALKCEHIKVIKHKTQIVFLLFGSLNKRKGLFTTLEMIKKLEIAYLEKIKIIFAGKIAKSDKKEFSTEYEIIKSISPSSVDLLDEFIPYKKIPSLFNEADYILLPYDITQASSGVLGHSAYFKKPIIGQGGGIFGKHVANYKLGLAVKNLNENKLLDIIIKLINGNIKIDYDIYGMGRYVQHRSGEYFASTIIETALH